MPHTHTHKPTGLVNMYIHVLSMMEQEGASGSVCVLYAGWVDGGGMEMLRVLVPNRVDAGLRMCRWQLKRDLFAPTRSSTLTINSFRYESSRSCELLPAFWSSLPNNSSSSLPTSHRASSAPSSNRVSKHPASPDLAN